MQAQTGQRIFESHLNRKAIIYVRQSTAHQVQMNNESLRMQLSLK